MASWKVAEAKARPSELIETALREGAQDITRHGKRTVVVVAAEEWDRKARRTEGLTEFLDCSPLKGSGLEVERCGTSRATSSCEVSARHQRDLGMDQAAPRRRGRRLAGAGVKSDRSACSRIGYVSPNCPAGLT